MSFDKLRRRSYIGGVVAAVTSLAGCWESNEGADTDPEVGSATADVDESTGQGDIPEHDHSTPAQGGGQLAPEAIEATAITAQQLQTGALSARSDASGRRIAPPGEFQSALAGAKPGDTVRMLPTTYRLGEELTVPQGVTLDFNGATIEPDSDHDVLFVDNGSKLVDPDIRIPTDLPYTSTVVHYDTNRSSGDRNEGAYTPVEHQEVDIEGLRIRAPRYPEADHSDSVGVHLDATGSYIMYNHIHGRIRGLGTQVLGTTTSDPLVEKEGNTLRGYINGNRIEVDMQAAQDIHVHHTGDYKMRSTIDGEMQPTSNVTNWGIVNDAGAVKSVHFRGVFWDASSMNHAATKGGHITMDLEGEHAIGADAFQESPRSGSTFYTTRDRGGWSLKNGEGESLSMKPSHLGSKVYTHGNESLVMHPSGGVTPPAQDVSQLELTNLEHGATYRHDGSSQLETSEGTASDAGYYVWDHANQQFVPMATFGTL